MKRKRRKEEFLLSSKFTMIQLSNVNLEYRDNALLYAFILKCGSREMWLEFASTCNNSKIRKKSSRQYSRLMRVWRVTNGIALKNPIPLASVEGNLYPIDGCKRIACFIAMGRKEIPYIIKHGKFNALSRNYSIDSMFFWYCPKRILTPFLYWRRQIFESWNE